MPFTLIRGTYHAQGYSPDGDTIRFQPDDTALLQKLRGKPAKINARNHISLRIEAIDALEHSARRGGGGPHLLAPTSGPGGGESPSRQPNVNGMGARIRHQRDDGTPGYILAAPREEKPRSWLVYGGHLREARASAGATLRGCGKLNLCGCAGLAYPTYYQGSYTIASALTRRNRRATAGQNVYAMSGRRGLRRVTAGGLTKICGSPCPPGSASTHQPQHTDGFNGGWTAHRRVLTRDEELHDFDTFVEQVNGNPRIALARFPEELVFDEMPAAPANLFSMVVNAQRVPTALLARPFIVPEGLTL